MIKGLIVIVILSLILTFIYGMRGQYINNFIVYSFTHLKPVIAFLYNTPQAGRFIMYAIVAILIKIVISYFKF